MADPLRNTFGPFVDRGDRLRQQGGGTHPAVDQLALVVGGPAVVANSCAGEVHDRVCALECAGGQRTCRGVPEDVAVAGVSPDQCHRFVACCTQRRDKGRTDEARGPGDNDSHGMANRHLVTALRAATVTVTCGSVDVDRHADHDSARAVQQASFQRECRLVVQPLGLSPW